MAEKSLSQSTYEAYLVLEAESNTKYEYHNGFIVAMAGGTPAHSQIGANVNWAVTNALMENAQPCRVYNSDLKVRIESINRTYYPDASVGCDEPTFSEKDPQALTNPTIIFEVLSKSNEGFDRGTKFHHYRQLTSLKEYVLLSQTEPTVDVYFRKDLNLWETTTYQGMQDHVHLKSLDCTIPVQALYRMVSL
ncbi:MAG: Uma2 family endonuclease [Bacteroidota bacterium]